MELDPTTARIVSAEFVDSVFDPARLPTGPEPELAFFGRSNVGKSSLLNAICSRRNLARTSSQPGRTASLNFYRAEIAAGEGKDGERRSGFLVDVPGYGYAQVSKEERNRWARLIEGYLAERGQLVGLLLLIDARRELTDDERWFLQFREGRALYVVLTKADQLSRNEQVKKQRSVAQAVGLEADQVFLSALVGGAKREPTALRKVVATTLFEHAPPCA